MASNAIKLQHLHNLIPFTNNKFFSIDKNLPPENNYSAFLATIMGDYKSQLAHCLYPATNQRDINVSHLHNNHGESINIIDFKVDVENMTNIRMIFMLITQEKLISPGNNSLILIPHFMMTGFVSQQNGEEIFTPFEFKNAVETPSVNNGELSLIDAKERGLFFQSFAYAEEAFLRIAADLPLDIKSQQKWLYDKKDNYNAQIALENKFNRTVHGLRFDINQLLFANNQSAQFYFSVRPKSY